METKDLEKVQEEQLNLKINGRYIHKKTTSEYIIVDISKMKHPVTDEWISAVIYKQYENDTSLWCRTVDSFKEHFTEVVINNDEIYL